VHHDAQLVVAPDRGKRATILLLGGFLRVVSFDLLIVAVWNEANLIGRRPDFSEIDAVRKYITTRYRAAVLRRISLFTP